MLLALSLTSASWLARPPPALAGPAALARPMRLAVTSLRGVRMCADEEPRVGGEPVSEGDLLLCLDDESDAWWRASVRDVRGSELLIHFSGCSDDFDVWMEASSPKLMRAEAAGEKDKAFQMDEYMDSLEDEELLEQMRQRKWAENARWQLNVFAQEQLGEWRGELTAYDIVVRDPADAASSVRLVKQGTSACTSAAAIEAGNVVRWCDDLDDAEASLSTAAPLGDETFYPKRGARRAVRRVAPAPHARRAPQGAATQLAGGSGFARTGPGNMAVGNAFTFSTETSTAAATPAAGGDGAPLLLLEVGLREAARRVRAKLLYQRAADEVRLCRVAVLTEVDAAAPPPAAAAAESRETPGTGLYDPPPGDRGSYCTLYCDGGITLAFPFRLQLEQAGAISLDWSGETMRYQADRKFARLDGSLSSFELTEISVEDSKTFVPRGR